jgi:acyl carrier protein
VSGLSKEDVEQVAALAWCSALHLPELPPRANIFSLGGDSLIAVIVAAEISDRLGVEISLSDLLDAPMFDDFVDLVASRANALAGQA